MFRQCHEIVSRAISLILDAIGENSSHVPRQKGFPHGNPKNSKAAIHKREAKKRKALHARSSKRKKSWR